MKALTIHKAYLSGVVAGDGWISSLSIGLGAKDLDFVEAFVEAFNSIFDRQIKIRQEKDYWVARTSNKTGKFDCVKTYTQNTKEEKAMWIRGLFDSDGNANLSKVKNGWSRKVAIYSTKTELLEKICLFLDDLGIGTKIYAKKNGSTHYGKKPMFELKVKDGRDNFSKFYSIVGSSILRKQKTLKAICESYVDHDYCKKAQSISAARKRDRALNERLPKLLEVIKTRIENCESVTARSLSQFNDYWSARKTLKMKHNEIVQRAREL